LKAPPKPKPKPTYAHVRRRTFKIDELEAAPNNARSITQEALRGLSASLERFGVLAMPIVNVAHNPPRIVGGHQRVEAMRQMGQTEVECVVVRFDEVKERQANFALNNPHIEGTFVPGLTRELLEELAKVCANTDELPDLRLDALLKQVIRSGDVTVADKAVTTGKVADDSTVVTQSTSVSKAGHLYALGEHRIMCDKLSAPGDLSVFGVDRAAMVFGTLTNLPDAASIEILDVLLRHSLQNVSGAAYFPVSTALMPLAHSRLIECGGYWSNTIACYTDAAPSKTVAFNSVALAMLYGWPVGQAHGFFGGRDQGNVWKLKVATGDHLPVEAVVKAIQNSTTGGQRVLDVLADGGTSLIAAEKTGRRLLGYVSSPREADRVRRRWAQFVHGEHADWQALTVAV
jgi:hypothetical protein